MSDTVLDIKNLEVSYINNENNRSVDVVSGINFTLKKGEILGIVGESGAGKSTVGHAVMAALKTGGVYRGNIIIDGRDITTLSESEQRKIRGKDVSVITQDPFSSLNPILTLRTHFCEMLDKEAFDNTWEATWDFKKSKQLNIQGKDRIFKALEEVDLPANDKFLNRYPFQISGGQSQRVIIALALLLGPKILVADEPTTALDVFVQEQILTLIEKLVKSHNMAMILITHNMGVVYKTADRVLVMKDSKFVEEQVPEKIFMNPKEEYTKDLIKSLPPKDRTVDTLHGKRKWDTKEEHLVIERLGLARYDAQSKDNPEKNIILECSDITFTVPAKHEESKSKTIIDSASFFIEEGKSLGLIGESGSGKSTLAKIVVGLNRRPSGVLYNGRSLGAKEIETDIQMIFQSPYSSLNPRKTLRNIWTEAIRINDKNLSKVEVEKKCTYLLDLIGLPSHSLGKYPQAFSGGQLQRICIARVLVLSPKIILCDEPTSALDISVQADILNLLKYLQKECNISMLFISHDLPVVRYMCDDIAVIKDGKIVEIQDREHLFNNPIDDYTRGLIQRIPSTPALIDN